MSKIFKDVFGLIARSRPGVEERKVFIISLLLEGATSATFAVYEVEQTGLTSLTRGLRAGRASR